MLAKKPEEDDACTKLQVNDKSIDQTVLEFCDCCIDRYLNWKNASHRKSNLALRTALVFTALTPVLLLIPGEYTKLLGAASAAVATIATELLAISGRRDNYVRYGYTWHALQIEKYRYLT